MVSGKKKEALKDNLLTVVMSGTRDDKHGSQLAMNKYLDAMDAVGFSI